MQADWIQPLHRLKPRLHPMYFYSPTIFMILDRTTQCGIDFSKLSIINLTYRYFNLHTPVCSSPPFTPLERIWSLPMPRLLWLQRRWLTQLPTVQLHLSVPSPECEGFLQEIVTFDATSIFACDGHKCQIHRLLWIPITAQLADVLTKARVDISWFSPPLKTPAVFNIFIYFELEATPSFLQYQRFVWKYVYMKIQTYWNVLGASLDSLNKGVDFRWRKHYRPWFASFRAPIRPGIMLLWYFQSLPDSIGRYLYHMRYT